MYDYWNWIHRFSNQIHALQIKFTTLQSSSLCKPILPFRNPNSTFFKAYSRLCKLNSLLFKLNSCLANQIYHFQNLNSLHWKLKSTLLNPNSPHCKCIPNVPLCKGNSTVPKSNSRCWKPNTKGSLQTIFMSTQTKLIHRFSNRILSFANLIHRFAFHWSSISINIDSFLNITFLSLKTDKIKTIWIWMTFSIFLFL